MSLLVFSFYYTEKIVLMVEQKNPVLKKIKENKDAYTIKAVDATVMNEYIIPGISGSSVNVNKSFYNMKELNTFNEYYLVYDDVRPTISVEDNKDKIIISGNKSIKNISIVIEYDEKLINLLANYDVNLIVTKDTYNKNLDYELLNGEVNENEFKQLNTLLNNDKLNSEICLVNENNKKTCTELKYYLVKYTHILTNNLIDIKSNIDSGDIIFIDKDASISDIKILLKQIKFQDLNIVPLSTLINETQKQ